MPYSNVLDVWMLRSNVRHCSLQTLRKCLRLGFKFHPAMLKLAMALVVDSLPVIVDDKTGNLDVVLGQFVDSIKHLFICEALSNCIPSAWPTMLARNHS